MYNTSRTYISSADRTKSSYSGFDNDYNSIPVKIQTLKRVPSNGGTRPLLGPQTNLTQAGQSKVNEYAEQMRLKREKAAKMREERKMREGGEEYVPPPISFKSNVRNGSSDNNIKGKSDLNEGRIRSDYRHDVSVKEKMDTISDGDSPEEEIERYTSAIKSVVKTTVQSSTRNTLSNSIRMHAANKPILTNKINYSSNHSTQDHKITPYDLINMKMTIKSSTTSENEKYRENDEETSVTFLPVHSRRKSVPSSASSTSSSGSSSRAVRTNPTHFRQQESDESEDDEVSHYEPTSLQKIGGTGRPQPLQQQNRKKLQQQDLSTRQTQSHQVTKQSSSSSSSGFKPAQLFPSEYPEDEDEENMEREECSICGRKFRIEILTRHQKICLGQKNKKIKKFKGKLSWV